MTTAEKDPAKTTPDVTTGSPVTSIALLRDRRRPSGLPPRSGLSRMGTCQVQLKEVAHQPGKVTATFCCQGHCNRLTVMTWTDPTQLWADVGELAIASWLAFPKPALA